MNSFSFHEKTEHGTYDFPFEYHYVTSAHPRYDMPFHWHKEWEIIHILKGSFSVHVDDEIYTAHAGDIVLLRDGMLHGGTPDNCIYECFLFDLHGLFRSQDMLKKHLRPLYRGEMLPEVFYPADVLPEITAAVTDLSEAFRRQLSSSDVPVELITFSCISRVFAVILEKKTYSIGSSVDSGNVRKIDIIKTILEYIEQHYNVNITLNELADLAGMNAKYFCRFFRSMIHQTPIDYVNMYRIEKAAQMLHSTELPVIDICMECGFNDCSNFIKVFRKYKGMTPKQYRKS